MENVRTLLVQTSHSVEVPQPFSRLGDLLKTSLLDCPPPGTTYVLQIFVHLPDGIFRSSEKNDLPLTFAEKAHVIGAMQIKGLFVKRGR